MREIFTSGSVGGLVWKQLILPGHFFGAGTNKRVPLLAVARNEPHRKRHPQPQAVLRGERTAALLGVVVAENAWKPDSNSKQWHTLRPMLRHKVALSN